MNLLMHGFTFRGAERGNGIGCTQERRNYWLYIGATKLLVVHRSDEIIQAQPLNNGSAAT